MVGGFQSELGADGCIPAAHPQLSCCGDAVLSVLFPHPTRSWGKQGFSQPLESQVVLGLSLEMDVVAPDNNIHFLGLRSWILVFRAILVFISVFIILRFMRF